MNLLRIVVILSLFVLPFCKLSFAHPMTVSEMRDKLRALDLFDSMKLTSLQLTNLKEIAASHCLKRKETVTSWRAYYESKKRGLSAEKPSTPLDGDCNLAIKRVKELLSRDQLAILSGLNEDSKSKEMAQGQLVKGLSNIRAMSDGQWRQYGSDMVSHLKEQAKLLVNDKREDIDEMITRYFLDVSHYPVISKPKAKTEKPKSWWKPAKEWRTIKSDYNTALP